MRAILKQYSIEYKLKVLSLFDEIQCMKTTLSRVGIPYSSRGMVWKWVAKKQFYLDSVQAASKAKKKFKLGSGRKPVLSHVEETRLTTAILDKRSSHQTIRYTDILSLASTIITLSDRRLLYSKGWFQRFVHRNKLSYRRITGSVTRPSLVGSTSLDSIITRFRNGIDLENNIYINMDETSVHFDMPLSYTWTQRGERRVKVRATSGQSIALTVLLTCDSTGQKYMPLVIVKNSSCTAREPEITTWNNQLLVVNTPKRAYINCKILKEWIHCSRHYLQSSRSSRRRSRQARQKHLLMDSCPAHKSKTVARQLESLGINYKLIPPRTTSTLQPLDVALMKPFKHSIRQQFIDYINQGATTVRGNYMKPSLDLLLTWISRSWSLIRTELVIKSFQKAFD